MSEKGHILTDEFKKKASRYLAYLKFQKIKGHDLFNLNEVSAALGFEKSDVSNDLHLLGIYHTNTSIPINTGIEIIESFLVVNRLKEAFLICTNEQGEKLINSRSLSEQGVSIIAAFDPSLDHSAYEIDGIKVLNAERINSLSDRMHVQFMIVATREELSQHAVNIAIKAGAKIIINISPKQVSVPKDVICISTKELEQLPEEIIRIKKRIDSNTH